MRAMKKDETPITVADILAGHTPEVRLLAERVRQIICQAVPEAAEKAYLHWHGIG